MITKFAPDVVLFNAKLRPFRIGSKHKQIMSFDDIHDFSILCSGEHAEDTCKEVYERVLELRKKGVAITDSLRFACSWLAEFRGDELASSIKFISGSVRSGKNDSVG